MRTAVRSWERPPATGHAKFQGGKVDVRIRLFEMQAGRNLSVLKNQRRLDQAGDAGGSFQVAQVRLYRTNGQRNVGRTVRAQSLREGVGFDRVADGRARPVRLDEPDLRGIDSRVCASVPDKARLSLRRWEARYRWCGHPGSLPTR